MMRRIVIFAPQRNGEATSIALELASAARALAERVEAFTFGEGADESAPNLGEHGVDAVVVVDLEPGAMAAPGLAATIADHVRSDPPDALFLPATYDGRDLAARLSARLDVPVLANVIGLSEEGEGLLTEHGVFGGSEIARARFTGAGPGIYLIRPKSFEALPGASAPAALSHEQAHDPGEADRARIVAQHVEEQEGPPLEDARIVVSGGRGLGDAASYALVERLAELLGAAAGASRAVVDAGWAPYSRQVGQTGKAVKPEVYLALGISGATQHLVGMKGSRHIVAVNRDATAPIFALAELGIVGNLHDIVPRLIAALEARR